MDGWMKRSLGAWMDRWMDEKIIGCINGWMDRPFIVDKQFGNKLLGLI